jgi:hypothetical protein
VEEAGDLTLIAIGALYFEFDLFDMHNLEHKQEYNI